MCEDIMKVRKKKFDLVYLDPPYARRNEKHPKDYYSLYHFFEGMLDYDNWVHRIDWDTANRCLTKQKTGWDTGTIEDNFNTLFSRFQDSVIVVSYGEPGFPSVDKIRKLLKQYKSSVHTTKRPYNYKLNHKNGGLYEVLIIGT
jgi:adenine-specific DNA methylase